MATYDKTRNAVAEVAREVCAWFENHRRGTLVLNGVPFEMEDVARCSEFVRECNFAATGRNEAGVYFGGTAKATEAMLKAAGKAIPWGEAEGGDIVCFNRQSGEFGHIGVVLDGTYFAENTSSKVRGPGFVVSAFSDIGRSRITGMYRLLPARAAATVPHDPPLVIGPDQRVVCEGKLVEGTLWAPVRAVVLAGGDDVVWHEDQGKAYLVNGGGA